MLLYITGSDIVQTGIAQYIIRKVFYLYIFCSAAYYYTKLPFII